MKLSVLSWRLLFALSLIATSAARADFREFQAIPVNDSLGQILTATAAAVTKDFPRLAPDHLALSLIDLTTPDAPSRADFHGDAPFYPASVIKLFFMVEVFRQEKHSPEIDRALREMIRLSDNDATAYLVDILSETTAGPELEGKALEEFTARRRALNRSFTDAGYPVSAMLKPWSFGPYGREAQLLGPSKENRNRATANAVAALLYSIVRGRAVNPEASATMMSLLQRPLDPLRLDENQVQDFLGASLPPGAKLWSKAGETSEVRHDAAYIELPGGKKFILIAFTSIGEDKAVLPAIGKKVVALLK